MTRACHAAAAVLVALLVPATLCAQSSSSDRSWEIGGGVVVQGGSSIGGASATQTRNQAGSAEPGVLFTAGGRLRAVAGLGARVAFRLTPSIDVEAGLAYSRPSIVTLISDDFEGAPEIVINNSSLHQLVVEVGAAVDVAGLGIAGFEPFVAAGVGYLRQLTPERTAVETGRVYHVGGGVKRMVGSSRLGLRFDARLAVRTGGFALDEGPARTSLAGGASAFVVF